MAPTRQRNGNVLPLKPDYDEASVMYIEHTRKVTEQNVIEKTSLRVPLLMPGASQSYILYFFTMFDQCRQQMQWTTGPKLYSKFQGQLVGSHLANWTQLADANQTVPHFNADLRQFKEDLLGNLDYHIQINFLRNLRKPRNNNNCSPRHSSSGSHDDSSHVPAPNADDSSPHTPIENRNSNYRPARITNNDPCPLPNHHNHLWGDCRSNRFDFKWQRNRAIQSNNASNRHHSHRTGSNNAENNQHSTRSSSSHSSSRSNSNDSTASDNPDADNASNYYFEQSDQSSSLAQA